MRFSEAFAHIPVGEAVPGTQLVRTERIFPCMVCRHLTGFRDMTDNAPAPVCSDECLDQMAEWRDEAKKEEANK